MGQRIIELLRERGWSRAELARRLDVSRMAVSAWCRGQDPSVDMLRKLATVLGVTETYLLHGTTGVVPPTAPAAATN